MRFELIGLLVAAALALSPLSWAVDAGMKRTRVDGGTDGGLTDFDRCMMLDCVSPQKENAR